MLIDYFIIITCLIFGTLDLFHKGYDYENMLTAGILSAVICVLGKIWSVYGTRRKRVF